MAWLEGRPVSEVLGSIVDNIQSIIRSEVRLARAELREEGAKAADSLKVLATGVLFGTYALGFLLLGGMFALAMIVQLWLAALIVGGVVAIVAAVLISSGLARMRQVHQPRKTIETLKENVEWAKHQIKSNGTLNKPAVSLGKTLTSSRAR